MKNVKPLHRLAFGAMCLIGCLAAFTAAGAPAPAAIDDCSYPSDAAAQAAWKPMSGSLPALATTLDGVKALRLRCNFSTSPADRASWDRAVKLNLADSDGIRFQIYGRDTLPVTYFGIYFQSGNGWYHADFFPESAGAWNAITLSKTALKTEGNPAGWDQIKTIRISAWRGQTTDTEFFLSGLEQTHAAAGILTKPSRRFGNKEQGTRRWAGALAQSTHGAMPRANWPRRRIMPRQWQKPPTPAGN